MLLPRVEGTPAGQWFTPRSARRVLCVFPRYADSFGTFQHAYPLLNVRAFMPPQGLLLIAAYLPRQWEVRFVDENARSADDHDYAWADVIFISGMHVQRQRIEQINREAHRHGKLTVLGGPSVSACPDHYRDIDLVHLGELGDATDAIVQHIDRSVERPGKQLVFRTTDRLPMDEFPIPAYHLLDLRQYFLGSVQFSSGCPFMCEFCDIPALYGRSPRLKSPERVCEELDAMRAAGLRGAVYFVDDNFVANPHAVRDLLPKLIDWQQRHGYPYRLNCEATLNLAKMPDTLAMMREANFTTVFCGIETPEPEALEAMRKTQNTRQPILDAVRTLNEHGLEVVSGIILGLDTDTPDTADRVLEFVERSQIPLLTINLLYALPKTPLYDRLVAEGRVIDEPGRATNVVFKLPYEQVLGSWRRCIDEAYEPTKLLARFAWQAEHTFRHRLHPKRKVTAGEMAHGLGVVRRVVWQVGWKSSYRRAFWRVAWPLLKQGRVEDVIHMAVVSHHLIRFAQDTRRGLGEASFYSEHRDEAVATAALRG
ncbi:B12-binding domain-containing radical SAM protein [Phycisphaerales bacterium AB-hyl4]|uniref:B12-binding domain-containing radical SAM protein n=1 Tax=Natronomicrosphaera hydrolytica TaxID=3242702 RepID=A0ABV4U6A6_9BACT